MPLPPVLSAAEIQIFRQNVVELKHPVPIITYLMLEAGLRIAEALRLRWESLVHADQPMHALVLPAGICKFKHGRTLPISARLADMIYISWDHGRKFLGLLPPMFVSQPAVQEALGHQRITTTQIYAHTDPDLLRTAIDEMYLEPAKGS
jgi:integrase